MDISRDMNLQSTICTLHQPHLLTGSKNVSPKCYCSTATSILNHIILYPSERKQRNNFYIHCFNVSKSNVETKQSFPNYLNVAAAINYIVSSFLNKKILLLSKSGTDFDRYNVLRQRFSRENILLPSPCFEGWQLDYLGQKGWRTTILSATKIS